MEDNGIYTLQQLLDAVNNLVIEGIPLDTPVIISSDEEGNEHHHGVYIYHQDGETWETFPYRGDPEEIVNPILFSPGGAPVEHIWSEDDES